MIKRELSIKMKQESNVLGTWLSDDCGANGFWTPARAATTGFVEVDGVGAVWRQIVDWSLYNLNTRKN
jgi:hypothetical protein